MNNIPLKNELSIESSNLKNGALVFRAINHPLRQGMLRLINEKGEMAVTQIYMEMKLEQCVASQQLGILRRAGFVRTKREGRLILYTVNYNRIEQLHQTANQLTESIASSQVTVPGPAENQQN